MSTFTAGRVSHSSNPRSRVPAMMLGSLLLSLSLVRPVLGQTPEAPAGSPATGGSGLSPIWAALYGAQNVDPEADSDGDGLSNRQEAIAGTDPFDSHSAPRISVFLVTNHTAYVRIVGALGKRYELQATEALCGNSPSNWFGQASMVARTNPVVILSAAANSPAGFFRV